MNFIIVADAAPPTPEPPPLQLVAVPKSAEPAVRPAPISRPARVVKAASACANKRWSDRLSVMKPGSIGSAGRDPVACTVLNLSKFGALLEIHNQVAADAFVLVFTANRVRSEVNCIVRWRSGSRIGVHFAGPIYTSVVGRRAF